MTKAIATQATRNGGALPEAGPRAWLYDVDREDAPIKVDELHLANLGDEQILWVDVDLEAAKDLDGLWSDLGIREEIGTLDTTAQRPHLVNHEGFVHSTFLRCAIQIPSSHLLSSTAS